MDANFTKCLGWVRVSEGGNDDDPDDAGGRTSRGITQREYDAYIEIAGLKGKVDADVWRAPDPIVDDIYNKSYWHPYCPTLPGGVDYVFFDECVNAGSGEAVYMLQAALLRMGFNIGPTGADRHFGLLTSAALFKATPAALVGAMSAVRVAIYRNIEARIPRDKKFDSGWMNRVTFCEKNALTLVPRNDAASA